MLFLFMRLRSAIDLSLVIRVISIRIETGYLPFGPDMDSLGGRVLPVFSLEFLGYILVAQSLLEESPDFGFQGLADRPPLCAGASSCACRLTCAARL